MIACKQCLKSSRAELKPPRKIVAQIMASQAQIGAEMIFSVLMLFGDQSNLFFEKTFV